MPWTPLFDESTEPEIVAKMMTVIHRDMKLALDYKYPSDNLPDFAVMTEGDQDQFSYPILTLAVQQGSSEETSGGEWLDQEVQIGMGLAVNGTTIKAVRLKAKKYVWALKAVLRKAVLELLGSEYMEYNIGFRWRYLKHGTEGTNVIQSAEVLMRIKFGET